LQGAPSRAGLLGFVEISAYRLARRLKRVVGVVEHLVPGAAQHENGALLTGTFAHTEYETIPNLRRTAKALRRVRETVQ
jgi:hypothetical protein